MPSPLFVGLSGHLDNLKEDLLDLHVQFEGLGRAHLTRALAFRLLSSAAVEEYVEQRCTALAIEGAGRFLSGRPTRTGQALVLWFRAAKTRGPLALSISEHLPQPKLVEDACNAYVSSVKNTHGMSGKDLSNLAWPLGCQDRDIDELLLGLLDSWSIERNRTAHARLHKIRAETTPQGEWDLVRNQILPLLLQLDDRLEEVLTTGP